MESIIRVTSLNIGKIKNRDWRGGTPSALTKKSINGLVALHSLGFEGDEQGNLKNHGGVDKAVLIIPKSNYALFGLNDPEHHFGFLGENITLSGIDETTICLGDQFEINGCLLEVTQPRSPCWKLNEQTGSKQFLKTYSDSGRIGFYCRVLKEGALKQGDAVTHIRDKARPGQVVFDLFLAKHHNKTADDKRVMQNGLTHPALSASWQQHLTDAIARNTADELAQAKHPIKLSKKERTKDWIKPPKIILKNVGKAIAQYKMLKEGDKVLLGLSGGKDSMVLLLVFKHLQRHAPINFELAACTIDPEIPGFDPSPLKEWLAKLDVPYFYESENLVALADAYMKGDSFCSFCARHKRGKLYTVCRREGYNVLALAQHLDDLAESFMMSALNAGELRTMKAHYLNNEKDIRIIRPLARVREKDTRAFAEDANLPIIQDNCPACYAKPQDRAYFKDLLLAEEKRNPHTYANLWRAMQPLIADDNHDGGSNIT